MAEVHGSKDCGNSPKNKFVQAIAVALATGKARSEDFSEEVIWERASKDPIRGRNALARELAAQAEPAAITVEHAISHGKVGAASGEVIFGNGQRHRFSHVLEFTNAKATCVSVIKSYT